MKPITLDEYKDAGEEFFPKYFYVAKELGEGAKTEDIIKCMEVIGGVAKAMVQEQKEGPFGFNKVKEGEDDADVSV